MNLHSPVCCDEVAEDIYDLYIHRQLKDTGMTFYLFTSC